MKRPKELLLHSLWMAGVLAAISSTPAADLTWIRTARVFLIDAYQPPFAPEMEYDANALAQTMTEMHANTVRISTMGKYATIQGVRFSTHPDLGKRDVLAETIAAVKPRGIRVIPYISTGHKLAWSMVTRDYPQYAQRTRPGGGPFREHMYVGEDHGTVCWNTPYRQAYLDLVEHVVRDYDIDGLYFDTWRPFYFWPGLQVCYCDGCREGFRRASGGKEIPWHENPADYTTRERETIAEYHKWYREQLIGVLLEVRRIVKSHKDIPLIYNVNNPRNLRDEDPRVLQAMDAFLYERGHSLLERAEGVSLARAAGLGVWPYVGTYNNWPRVIPNGLDYQQEIFATVAFGGAPIVAQPYGYITDPVNRRWVSFPFSVIQEHEADFTGFENVPYAAVVYAEGNSSGHAASSWYWPADVRSATLGAFAACLYGHVQVSSVAEMILDQPEKLARYRVLYLADVPHLTAQRVANIQRFVENGGGLLASHTASLSGPGGERLERFALEDLLRVRPLQAAGELAEILNSYRCMIGGPNDLYLLPSGESGNAATQSGLIPLWYFEPVEALEGGIVEMNIVRGDEPKRILPGVVVSRHGKGRVIYLASSLESLYSSTKQSLLGNFLRGLVEEAAGGPPPCRVEGPPSLIANLTQNGNRRVLHLLNWTGDAENEANYLPPVENVTVRMTIPDGMKVRRVSSFLDAALRQRQSGQELEILLPRVEAYQAVAVELE
jgi:hypothetical protein